MGADNGETGARLDCQREGEFSHRGRFTCKIQQRKTRVAEDISAVSKTVEIKKVRGFAEARDSQARREKMLGPAW
jgi:hypothetical protein